MTPTEKGAACFAATFALYGAIILEDASEAFACCVVEPEFAHSDEEQEEFMHGWDSAFDAAEAQRIAAHQRMRALVADRALFDAADYEG